MSASPPPPPALDIAPGVRRTIRESAIGAYHSTYRGGPAVFTRRPVPDGADMPLTIVNPDSAVSDQDGLSSSRPVVVRNIATYGRKGEPGTSADQTRTVEAIAWGIRDLFHRQKFSVRAEGFSVIDIVATGPVPAPVDDEGTIGRMVTLTVRLKRSEGS